MRFSCLMMGLKRLWPRLLIMKASEEGDAVPFLACAHKMLGGIVALPLHLSHRWYLLGKTRCTLGTEADLGF
jgi:hypothetical protein